MPSKAADMEALMLSQLQGQHLLSPADGSTVLRDLCGVQAQFLSNAFHALSIRTGGSWNPDNLIKTWSIRGTMHLFSQEDLPLFLHQGRTHALRPRDTLEEDANITRDRKLYFAQLILETIGNGVQTREALKAACTAHGMTETEAESLFDPWGGVIRALCETGQLCHTATQQKAYRRCPPFVPMGREEARLEMARRYFTNYGPATVKDAAYYFAATQAEVKAWLNNLPVTAVEYRGRTYFSIDSSEPPQRVLPACIFLAGFDPLMLGYQKTESLYLPPEHLRKIFSLAGIVMPSLLLHGRVVGHWKIQGQKLSVLLFEPIPPEEARGIQACAEAQWPILRSISLSQI